MKKTSIIAAAVGALGLLATTALPASAHHNGHHGKRHNCGYKQSNLYISIGQNSPRHYRKRHRQGFVAYNPHFRFHNRGFRQQRPHFARGSHFRGHRIDQYARHGLYQPPRGQVWRRHGNDAYLTGAKTGLVAGVVIGALLSH